MSAPDEADNVDQAWKKKVAEAASRAAEELAKEPAPQLQRLRADLEALHQRLA